MRAIRKYGMIHARFFCQLEPEWGQRSSEVDLQSQSALIGARGSQCELEDRPYLRHDRQALLRWFGVCTTKMLNTVTRASCRFWRTQLTDNHDSIVQCTDQTISGFWKVSVHSESLWFSVCVCIELVCTHALFRTCLGVSLSTFWMSTWRWVFRRES